MLVKEMHENDESFYKYFRMTPERFASITDPMVCVLLYSVNKFC